MLWAAPSFAGALVAYRWVATVAVDGTKNAGFLAARILSIKYPEIREQLAEAREKARAAYG